MCMRCNDADEAYACAAVVLPALQARRTSDRRFAFVACRRRGCRRGGGRATDLCSAATLGAVRCVPAAGGASYTRGSGAI